MTERATKIWRGAYGKYEVGIVFQETDGPYVVTKRQISNQSVKGRPPLYDYFLRKLTPEEAACHEVLSS